MNVQQGDEVLMNPMALQGRGAHQQVSPLPQTPARETFIMLSHKDTLMKMKEFGDVVNVEDKDAYIKKIFEEVTSRPIAHVPIDASPFMIGMTYMNKLAFSTHDKDLPKNVDALDSLELSKQASDIFNYLKEFNTFDKDKPFSGMLYSSDKDVETTDSCDQLLANGAICIAVENLEFENMRENYRTGAYFVSEKLVALAINNGRDERLRIAAEKYKMFTISYAKKCLTPSSGEFTLTTRHFDDILTLSKAMAREQVRKLGKNGKIAVSFGFHEIMHDEFMLDLSQRLVSEYEITYCLFNNEAKQHEITRIVNRTYPHEYDSMSRRKKKEGRFSIQETKDWSFSLSWVSSSAHNSDFHSIGQPLYMTIPILHLNANLQISLHAACTQDFLEFATKLYRVDIPQIMKKPPGAPAT